MQNKYVFKPYSEVFPELFAKEKARIAAHLQMARAIEHVGSTAIPGLGGKGIIDIAIAVEQQDLEAASKALQDLGYAFKSSFSTPDRLYFVIYLPDQDEGSRRYHVHLIFAESKEWKELTGFRNFLRAHPEEAREYAEIKKQAVKEANQEGEHYRKIKDPFFKKIAAVVNRSYDSLISLYQERMKLNNSVFMRIDHDDAMVAVVYKVTVNDSSECILKIQTRTKDFLREVYFLKHFAGMLRIPKILGVVEPEPGVSGAILMEYLPGTLLNITDLTDALAYELGVELAKIHLSSVAGYGDLFEPNTLCSDPRTHFTSKFEEGLTECCDNLPRELMERCKNYFDAHVDLLTRADGPCVIHRDFRPGNVIVNEGRLQGIIDWASARSGFAEEDFCPFEHGEWGKPFTCKQAFLTGYASIRPVPDCHAMMPLLRLSKAIATIGFTVKMGTWDNVHSRVYQINRQFLEGLL